jgi:hypothetical protein
MRKTCISCRRGRQLKVVVGVTYDGAGNFTNWTSFERWKSRFDWLMSPAVIPDPAVLACGLSTDAIYDVTAISDRIGAMASAGVAAVHVFALPVPPLWLQALQSFLGSPSAPSLIKYEPECP